MAADSSMGFHQGTTASMYNNHMLSFQYTSDVAIGGGGGSMATAPTPSSVSGASSNAGLYLSPNIGVISNSSRVGPSWTSFGDVGSSSGLPECVTYSTSDWTDQEVSILKEGPVRLSGSGSMATAPTPNSVTGASNNAGLYLSPNIGVINNSSGVGPSWTSSRDVGSSSGLPECVTFSTSDWTDLEVSILKEGFVRYAREPTTMMYIKIAALLPNKTIRDVAKVAAMLRNRTISDVALRCCWSTGKDKRKKPCGVYPGKKIRYTKLMQEKMVTSSPMTNFHMTHANNVTPFSISMQQSNQHYQVPIEAPVVDSATQCLLEENNQLLNKIAANIETFKREDNTNLFLRTRSNIKAILCRMSETPGIMGRMPPLPVQINEDQLNSLLQLERMVASYGTFHHTKEKSHEASVSYIEGTGK